MPSILRHVFVFTYRDWRGGELKLLLGALVIAVASLAAVGFFVDRLRSALDQQASQMLGADLVVRSSREIPPEFTEQALRLGLKVAHTVEFPSMVGAGGLPKLASVKAVSEAYPLLGGLRILSGDADKPAITMPTGDQAWVDPQLAVAIGAKRGDALSLGDIDFALTEQIAVEPDRGGGFASLAPRIMIPMSRLPATGLIQAGSRVTNRLMVAGDALVIASFNRWLGARLSTGQRVETVTSGRPEMRATLNRAEQFLSLVALLTALIAAVAVALAGHRFAQRHLDACAVIKAIGVTQGHLMRILIGELLLVALLGGVIGAAVGWALHFGLSISIAPVVGVQMPPAGILPAVQAMMVSVTLLLGFGAWPFVRLARVAPLRVLRRDPDQGSGRGWLGGLIAIAVFCGLLFWLSNDARLATFALAGFAGGAVVFALSAFLLLVLLGQFRRLPVLSRLPVLRLALASWSRRGTATVVQTVALSIGLMALALLTVTRTDLIEGWAQATPADAPNRFVVNIQPDQHRDVGIKLTESGVKDAAIVPMVRGRLVEINGRPAEENLAGERGQQAASSLRRELNLSYMEKLPDHNALSAGTWFDAAAAEVSVEEGLFKSFRLALGDQLTFDIAGEMVSVVVSSVRKVDWGSMRLNFYMIMSPVSLQQMPQTWATAYRQDKGTDIDRVLVKTFPNLTIFDTGLILRQVQRLLAQVIKAVQFLFLLTLAAGIVVLYGALASSRDERIQEASLMRALGASRRQLASAHMAELALTGGMAGFLAAGGALLVGAVLADQVFQFELNTRWSMLLWGFAGGGVLAVVAGWMGLRPVLSSPPMLSLRAQ